MLHCWSIFMQYLHWDSAWRPQPGQDPIMLHILSSRMQGPLLLSACSLKTYWMRPDGENSQREEKVRQLLVRVAGRAQQLLGNIQAMYSFCHCCFFSLCPWYHVLQPAVTCGQTVTYRLVLCISEALGTWKHLSLPAELGHKVGEITGLGWTTGESWLWGVKGTQKAADLSVIQIICVFIPLHIAGVLMVPRNTSLNSSPGCPGNQQWVHLPTNSPSLTLVEDGLLSS